MRIRDIYAGTAWVARDTQGCSAEAIALAAHPVSVS